MFRFKREIYRRPGELYLTRYYLFRTNWLGVYIHKLHVSDYPVPHDHPWDFISCPLKTGYIEYDEHGKGVLRKPFRPAFRPAKRFHWLEKLDNRPTWSLFIRFKRIRDWGFLTNSDWISEKDYNYTLGVGGK
jgi:hypothetical protein